MRRARSTELRLRQGVSEYQMSYDLEHIKSYIHTITSGKSLPSLSEMLAICDYFGIGIWEFFGGENHAPTVSSGRSKNGRCWMTTT